MTAEGAAKYSLTSIDSTVQFAQSINVSDHVSPL